MRNESRKTIKHYGKSFAINTVWFAATIVLGVSNMQTDAQERISQATAIKVPELVSELGKIYKSEGPLGTVSRQLYVPHPKPNVSSVITTDYISPKGIRRYEVLTYQVFDDVYQDAEKRYSDDNGKTWSEWQRDTESDIYNAGDYSYQNFAGTGPNLACYDPVSKMLVQPFMLRTFGGDPRKVGLRDLNHHVMVRSSKDNGKTWLPETMMKYENGPDYDPAKMRDPTFMVTNETVYYYNILRMKNGELIFPCSNIPIKLDVDGKTANVTGVICFVGKWNKNTSKYEWKASKPIGKSKNVTGYIEEPWLAELGDGKILVDLRGTNQGTPNAPGRHWYSISKDNGKTWSEPEDWRYDDGEQFLSPATMGKILRHSKTGKLYWFGNISRGPTSGNSPRYPFYIAEIDESKPAIKRSTLTIIDDYDSKRHTTAVQFSNFYVFENRETGEFKVYLSPYGQYSNVYQANVYKYTIKLKK